MLIPFLSCILCLYIITLSWIHYTSNSYFNTEIHEIHGTIILKIETLKKETSSGNRYIATLFEHCPNGWSKKGKTLLFFQTKKKIFLEEGAVIISKQHPTVIKKNQNPGGFDYYSFSKMNGVFYSTIIEQDDPFFILGNHRGWIGNFIFNIRKNILGIIRKYLTQKDQLGIAEAMLIGYKPDVSSELNTLYANAGVSHVIAISGMHLGLIYLMVHQIFAYVFKKKYLHIIAILITLPMLWIFSMVTGAGASVVRSAIMYSFIIVGNLISKKSNSLNALLGAGFMMNVLYPDILNDLGFQLSFAAVLSIILFYQHIKNAVYTKNKILQMGWNLIAVSIAAQIITTPILIYHFQKFSTYALLNNIVIVPLSSAVLLLEIILCLCPFQILSATVWAPIIGMIIGWMNEFTTAMSTVPYSVISFPFLEWYQVLLYSVLCLAIWFFLIKKVKMYFLMLALATTFIIQWIDLFKKYEHNQLHQLVLLHLKSSGCIIHQHGNEAVVYLYGNPKKLESSTMSTIQNALKKLDIKNYGYRTLPKKTMIIHRRNLAEAIIINANELGRKLNHDLFMRNSSWILDGSTKLWKIKEWQKQAQNLHLRFQYTADAGPIFLDCQDFHAYTGKKIYLHAKKN